jgi:teichuronic acid exporter
MALNDGFLHMTKLLGLVTFPMLMGLTAVANVFIQSVFGQKWMEAVPILQIMAIVGILRVLMNPNGSVILAKGKANIAFYWDAGVLILYGVSLWGAVLTGSLEAVAWTYAAVSFVNFIVGRWLLAWLIQLRWKEYIKTIAVPFGLSLIMTVTAYFIKETSVGYFPQAAIWPLLISVSAGAGLYIVLLGFAYPNFIKKRTRGQQL